ncbi:5-deoxy-glucuronate isomerase [Streptomyces sp. NPDC003077]|uniref:5-deoxy-glucuronate isomerase n=1 Tax=Streptomyces sp. NPDC003077 TaxID=3154443 RepID=UPI0033A26AB6
MSAMNADFHLRAGYAAPGPYALDISPESAGWAHSSLRVLDLPPGGSHEFATGDSEWIVLPLSGGCTVTLDSGEVFELAGRASVFSGVTDFAYVPRDAHARITTGDGDGDGTGGRDGNGNVTGSGDENATGGGDATGSRSGTASGTGIGTGTGTGIGIGTGGGRFALAGARCTRRLAPRYAPARDVPVELRGTGTCSRQVNNFAAADAFACDKLIAVEVLTPGGNWSSYPPHKHDDHRPGEESELEEIYYFEIAAPHGSEGVGYQRVTPSGRGRGTDVLAEVRTGDAVLIPDGWHGPSIASPGHTMYYLNVMAGPGDDRQWLIRDHPDHAWIRDTWPTQPVDPRLPFYTAPSGDTGDPR